MQGLDNLIKRKVSFDKKISEESLMSSKAAILTKIEKIISKFKTRIKPFKFNPILK